MTPLTADEVLRLWEQGQTEHPLERTLTLAGAVRPDLTREELARLPLGDLNSGLLQLHEANYGRQLRGQADCPRCSARLEFQLTVSDLLEGGSRGHAPGETLWAEDGGLRLHFRLPDSFDLAAAARCGTAAQARETLVERCVVEVRRGDASVALADLPGTALETLAGRMAEADPHAELLVDLQCADCGHAWQSVLDPGVFVWTELAAHARRLLREVHTLARAYGWSEAGILALSDRRRAAYLELVGGVV